MRLRFDPRHRFELVVLTVVVIVAAGLRLVELDAWSLWNDELSAWEHSRTLSAVSNLGGVDPHPRGYYFFLWLFQQVLGDSAWALRFPSALAGILAVIVAGVGGWRLLHPQVGVAAALFCAFSPGLVEHARSVRMYGLLSLCTTALVVVAAVVVRELLDDKLQRRTLAGLWLAGTLAFWTHFTGGVIVLVVGLALFGLAVMKGRGVRALALVGASFMLAFLPLLPRFALATDQMAAFKYSRPAPSDLLDAFFGPLPGGTLTLGLIVVLLVWRRASAQAQTGDPRGLLVVAGLWLLVGLAYPSIVYLKSITSSSVWLERSLVAGLSAPLLLVAALGFARPVPRGALVAFCVLVALPGTLALQDKKLYESAGARQQIREAARYLAQENEAQKLPLDVPVVTVAFSADYGNFYLRDHGLRSEHFLPRGGVYMTPFYEQAPRPGDRIWLFEIHRRIARSFRKKLEKEYRPLKRKELRGARVTLYARK